MRPLVLHLSGDYPDPVRNRTTFAVKNFIDLLDECDHVVVSLKRFSSTSDCYRRVFPRDGNVQVAALGYWAPPGGILHLAAMRLAERDVEGIIDELGIRPDLVMAHKLTIEGVIAHELRRRRGYPYACSVRGEVEKKFFRFKPLLRWHFASVIREAEALFYVSAWFEKTIEGRYPNLVRRHYRLPNFVSGAVRPSFEHWDERAFLSVLDLAMYRRKGFPELIAGLARARSVHPGLRLDVIGWSTPETMKEVREIVARAGVEETVSFLGVMSHPEVLRRMPRYAALVLPARNETFGMVYAEALLSGLPLLYARDSGIDGYLDGFDVGVRVSPGDVAAIADGLVALTDGAARYRESIRNGYDGLRARFSPDAYLDAFRSVLAEARVRPSPAAAQKNGSRGLIPAMEEQNVVTRNLRA